MELDSLTDFVSFGIAPVFILYFWELNNYGKLGWAITLIYSVCCVLRLARFNLTKISEMPAVARGFISNLDLPVVYDPSWTQPVPANKRRISIVSTAAVHRRGHKPFSWLAKDFRAFDKTDRDLVMTHVAVEFDRSAWQQDLNTIIPLERLKEMADDGEIGSVAEEHYSFMGAADPVTMEKSARQAAARMKQDGVNTVFLIPI